MSDIFRTNSGIFPLGIPISHSWIELGGLLALIEEYEISLFVELGIHAGGLAAMLAHRTEYRWSPNPKFSYLGIENRIEDVHPRLVGNINGMHDAEIWHGDVFSKPLGTAVQQRIIESDRRAMVYCDNGDKPKELETYKDLLRSRDIIATHDYPKEITDDDFESFGDLLRLTPDYLEHTRIVAFWKK